MPIPRRLRLIAPAVLCAQTALAQSFTWSPASPPAVLPPGAVVVYCSASSGSDANPGTMAAPVKTLARLYEKLPDGTASWGLLKRGDTWQEAFPFWSKASGSAAPMVIGSYGGSGDLNVLDFACYLNRYAAGDSYANCDGSTEPPAINVIDFMCYLNRYAAGDLYADCDGGTAPRPRLRTPANTSAINLGTQDRRGLAFLDLDLEPATPGGSNYAGIQVLGHWRGLLFENLKVSRYPGNIVIQDIEQTHITMDDIRIRGCTIVDSYDTGPGHSQGIFLRDCSAWVIEGCIIDNNARNKADIFCHNVYVNEGCGAGDFRNNISSRACSHGVQQRPGGTLTNNLFLGNPIAVYQGTSAYAPVPTNICRWNVVLDSRDINASNTRGIGIEVGDAQEILCDYNIIAHQGTSNGPYNIFALAGEPFNSGTIVGNFIGDWGYAANTSSMGCNAIALGFYNGGSGLVRIEENQLYQRSVYGQVVAHSTPWSPRFVYRSNRYYSASPASLPGCYSPFDVAPGQGGDFGYWVSRTGDTGSSFLQPPAFDVTIARYMAVHGLAGAGADAFMALAREQERGRWDMRLDPDGVNDWARAVLGVVPNP